MESRSGSVCGRFRGGKVIQEFYYGSSWHWPLAYLPRVMLSYNMLRKIRTLWNINIPFMMDSGAFAVINKYGRYPYAPEEYANLGFYLAMSFRCICP